MTTALSIIVLITSLVLIVAVGMMESEQQGLGTIDGTESLWGAHKGSGKKEMLNKTIIVTSIIFAVALIVMAAL